MRLRPTASAPSPMTVPPAARSVYVTGTDTGVGKTLVATQLVAAAARRRLRVAAMKPVAAGATRTPAGLRNDDALQLIAATGRALDYGQVNPYCFEEPISPHLAARSAGIAIDPEVVRRAATALATGSDWLVVEGAGGWRAPLSDALNMADIAGIFGYPVVIVVGLRLGCLNHAALTRDAVEQSGLPLAGWIASQIEPQMSHVADNLATLARILGRAPLGVMPWNAPEAVLATQGEAALQRLANGLRSSHD